MINTLLWHTSATANVAGEDRTLELATYVPAPGESVALVVTFPPDSVFDDPEFDFAAARAEQQAATPGLADLFEQESPGMHTTPSVDYGVVLDGEIVLDLDGASTILRSGDIVVQNGTRHAWRNTGDKPATMFIVLIGARTSFGVEVDSCRA
jgi:quercetin dioxygenase-like cupin family protein